MYYAYIFSAGLVGDDIFNWEVIIIGPPETLYEGKKMREVAGTKYKL